MKRLQTSQKYKILVRDNVSSYVKSFQVIDLIDSSLHGKTCAYGVVNTSNFEM